MLVLSLRLQDVEKVESTICGSGWVSTGMADVIKDSKMWKHSRRVHVYEDIVGAGLRLWCVRDPLDQ